MANEGNNIPSGDRPPRAVDADAHARNRGNLIVEKILPILNLMETGPRIGIHVMVTPEIVWALLERADHPSRFDVLLHLFVAVHPSPVTVWEAVTEWSDGKYCADLHHGFSVTQAEALAAASRLTLSVKVGDALFVAEDAGSWRPLPPDQVSRTVVFLDREHAEFNHLSHPQFDGEAERLCDLLDRGLVFRCVVRRALPVVREPVERPGAIEPPFVHCKPEGPMDTSDKRTLADILQGLVTLAEGGVADLVIVVCATLGVALCLFAAYRLYITAMDDRASEITWVDHVGAILAFFFGAGLMIVSIVAARLSTLYSGT